MGRPCATPIFLRVNLRGTALEVARVCDINNFRRLTRVSECWNAPLIDLRVLQRIFPSAETIRTVTRVGVNSQNAPCTSYTVGEITVRFGLACFGLPSSQRTKSQNRHLTGSNRAWCSSSSCFGCCRAQSQLSNEHLFVLGLVRSAFQHSESDVECVSALGNAFQHSEWGVKIENFEKFYFLLFRFP